MDDVDLEVLFPDAVHEASFVHGTPVRVTARIVALLGLGPGDPVLDIGAGAGKFAIVASALSGARVRGVERDPRLVAVAREAARRLRVQVTFEEGSFTPVAAEGADVVYLFNPFTPTAFPPGSWPGKRRGPRGTAAAERASAIAAVTDFPRGRARGPPRGHVLRLRRRDAFLLRARASPTRRGTRARSRSGRSAPSRRLAGERARQPDARRGCGTLGSRSASMGHPGLVARIREALLAVASTFPEHLAKSQPPTWFEPTEMAQNELFDALVRAHKKDRWRCRSRRSSARGRRTTTSSSCSCGASRGSCPRSSPPGSIGPAAIRRRRTSSASSRARPRSKAPTGRGRRRRRGVGDALRRGPRRRPRHPPPPCAPDRPLEDG